MGRAVIIEHIGKGLYNVDVFFNQARIEALIEDTQHLITRQLTEIMPGLAVDTAEKRTILDAAEAETQVAMDALIVIQLLYESDPSQESAFHAAIAVVIKSWKKEVKPLLEWRTAVRIEKEATERYWDLKRQLWKLQDQLVENPQRRHIYCMDYADGEKGYPVLKGVVGTRELDSINGSYTVIDSSFPDGARTNEYDYDRDGMLMAQKAIGDWSIFYNAVAYPPYIKWLVKRSVPAVITKLNKKTELASIFVELTDEGLHWIKGEDAPLIRDHSYTLHDVPFSYMDCGAAPFEVGDRVMYDKSETTPLIPSIVGFLEGPRPCPLVGTGGFSSDNIGFGVDEGTWVKRTGAAACGNIVSDNFGFQTGEIVSFISLFRTLGSAVSSNWFMGGTQYDLDTFSASWYVLGIARVSRTVVSIVAESKTSPYNLSFFTATGTIITKNGADIVKPDATRNINPVFITADGENGYTMFQNSDGDAVYVVITPGNYSTDRSGSLNINRNRKGTSTTGPNYTVREEKLKTTTIGDYVAFVDAAGDRPVLGIVSTAQELTETEISTADCIIPAFPPAAPPELDTEIRVNITDNKIKTELDFNGHIHLLCDLISYTSIPVFSWGPYTSWIEKGQRTERKYYYIDKEGRSIYDEYVAQWDFPVFGSPSPLNISSTTRRFVAFGEVLATISEATSVVSFVFPCDNFSASLPAMPAMAWGCSCPTTDPPSCSPVPFGDNHIDSDYHDSFSWGSLTYFEPQGLTTGRGGILARIPMPSYTALYGVGSLVFSPTETFFYFSYLEEEEVKTLIGTNAEPKYGVY